MKFGAVVGNPPYQRNISIESSNSSLSKQLFPDFVRLMIMLTSKYTTAIIPARWFAGDAQDKSFLKLRRYLKEANNIVYMNYFEDSTLLFPDIELKGGACYFLTDIGHAGDISFEKTTNKNTSICSRPLFIDGFDVVIPSENAVSILQKIRDKSEHFLTELTRGRNAFGIIGKPDVLSTISRSEPFPNAHVLRCKGNKLRYIEESAVTKNIDLFLQYKVFISKSSGAPHTDRKVIGTPYFAEPRTACTDSLISIGGFSNPYEANSLVAYLKTKFLRYLVQTVKSSQNVTQIVYRFVPMQDFTENSDINWDCSIEEIDQQLYKKYGLTTEEIEFIEKNVQPM